MLSQKVKGLIEGFVTGSIATSVLYTIALQAGYIVSAQGAGVIVDQKIQPIKDNVDTILLLSLEARIRDLVSEQCVASPGTKRILQTEIDRLQKQHLDIAKIYYSVSVSCS